MKLFLYRCLVFVLFSIALALVACPWTDSAVKPATFRDLLAVVVDETVDTTDFSEVQAADFPRIAATASNLTSQNHGNTPTPTLIGLREWKRLCDSIELAACNTARVTINGISMVIWHGEHAINLPIELPFFGAMRRSAGWILLFFAVILTRRLYSPPPFLPHSVLVRVIFWDVLAVLALTITAFLFLQYLATAVYGLTPSADAPLAQLVALSLYVPLLPLLSALITVPCRRADPHF